MSGEDWDKKAAENRKRLDERLAAQHLTVTERVRFFSAPDEHTAPSPQPKRKSTMTADAAKAQLELKFESFEVEFTTLDRSLEDQPPNLEKIKENLDFLQSHFATLQKLNSNLIVALLKDDKKKDECKAMDERVDLLSRRVYQIEKKAKLLLQPSTPGTPSTMTSPGKTVHLTRLHESLIAAGAKTELKNALAEFDGALKKIPIVAAEVEDKRDITAFLYETFVRDSSPYLEYLRIEEKTSEYQKETKEAKEFFRLKSNLDREARKILTPLLTPPTFTGGSSGSHRSFRDDYHDMKDLPQLANSVKEWNPFWSLFKETDRDTTLNEAQKFRKLTLATKEGSEAREIVINYSMLPNNYASALAHLKRTYGRDSVLIKVYVRELLQIGLNHAVGKQLEFRKLVNEITAQVRNLEVLGVTKDKCALILYPVIETCLPKHILQMWQHDPNHSDDLEKILKFLQDEVNNENERRLAHFQFGDLKAKEKGKWGGNKNKKEQRGGKKETPPTATSFHNAETNSSCVFCDGRHASAQCNKALNMGLEDKKEKLKAKGICFVCLGQGHRAKTCSEKEKVKCGLCQGRHPRALCPSPNLHRPGGHPNPPPTQRRENLNRAQPRLEPNAETSDEYQDDSPPEEPASSRHYANMSESSQSPLRMLLLKVEGPSGKRKLVRALLDDGSNSSCITKNLAKELGLLKVGEERVIHQLFGGAVTPPQSHDIFEVNIAGPDGESPRTYEMSSMEKIAHPIQTVPMRSWVSDLMKFGVELPRFGSHHQNIELLIANDVISLYTHKEVHLGMGIAAMETIWGWVLGGKVKTPRKAVRTNQSNLNISTALMNSSISALWDLDVIGIRDEPSTQSKEELEKQTEEHFLRNLKRTEKGRYEVKLPFLTGASDTLSSNFYSAERRLRSTADSLIKMNYLLEYDSLLKLWEADGMIEEVSIIDNPNWKEEGHFLPHRAVVKLSSATTPIRPVFDASAKSKGSPSLNDCLEAGPNYLELIPSILTRFRLNRIGVTSDVKKAFQQISISPEHRKFVKFIWYENPKKKEKIKVFCHTRVVFGVASSPFLLAATLKYHLQQSPATHMDTAEALKGSLYVDNCAVSLPSMEQAIHFKEQCAELLEPAQFDLRGWELGPSGEDRDVPILGLIWNLKTDRMRVDLESALEKIACPPTQRNVLAIAHSIYDPLGMLSPFILLGKLILRGCHEEKLGWDKPLPPQLEQQYKKWSCQIHLLKEIEFPRHVQLDRSTDSSLHVFSDASSEAYAAAVFLRCDTKEGVVISLLQSKARIATKAKKITIPRLELIGCLIGARLASTVKEDIGLPELPTTYYTDSSTSLAWIKGEGPWGIFVHNRVQEIRNQTSVAQWRHVRGKDNPADLPSRGCSAKKLNETQWWEGPSWLYLPEKDWPTSTEIAPDPQAVETEKKKTVAVNVAARTKPHPLEKTLKFSSYPKILRVTSYWLRYRQILRDRIHNPCPSRISLNQPCDVRAIPEPTTAERRRAEKLILQLAQKDLGEKQMRKLRPFLQDGLLKTSTPILVDTEESFTHPVILPDENEFTKRILRFLHEENCHIGTQLLLAKARERFWIINGRRTCRKIVSSCWICRRYNSRRLEVPEPHTRPLLRAEYLGGLRNQRPNGHFQPLKPGDVVLLEQDNEKRSNWPLGVIVEAIPGRDDFPRKYLVRTKQGVSARAAETLFLMELDVPSGCSTGVVQPEDQERTAPDEEEEEEEK